MNCTDQDVFGKNFVRNDAGELALTDKDKINAWVEHCARLLNLEFEWSSNEHPEVPPTAAPLLVCPRPWSAKRSARWNEARLLARLASYLSKSKSSKSKRKKTLFQVGTEKQ